MPTLFVKVTPLQNTDRYAALAAALTQLSTDLLGKRPEVTAVVIEDLPATHWYIGGVEAVKPSAFLEISVTAGTNTAAQKAAFIAAAFAELQRQVGFYSEALEAASYVVVRELPASDWGYGGVTQAARRQAVATA